MSENKPGPWPSGEQGPAGGPAAYPSGAAGPYPGSGPDPYPGSGPGPYPAAPSYAPPPAAGPHEVPQTVTAAFYLMVAGAVLTFLGALLGFTQTAAMRDSIREQNGAGSAAILSESEIDTAITTGLILGVVFALIQSGLWLWMAFANRSGRNWARITGTVFCGVNALFFVLGLAGASLMGTPGSPVSIAVGAVILGVGIAAVCALWHPNSRQHFAPAPPTGYQPYPR